MSEPDVLTLLPDPRDPLSGIARWVEDAAGTSPNPNAMALATVRDGQPAVRMVLLKGVDRGLVFFTNFESRKGRELRDHPAAAVAFHWDALGRQIRAEGSVELVAVAEADAYFASRPRESQLGAWASRQSEPLGARAELLARFQEVEAEYEGREVPRPPHWGGFRLIPDRVEFWLSVPNRLHDRARFRREAAGGWHVERLFP